MKEKNPYIESLIDRIEGLNTLKSMADWVCAHTTISGQPFSFKRHEFQRQILDDMHPRLCCKKLSQVGLTEVSIRKTIGFLCQNQGRSALYSFPTTDMRDRNVKTRIRPILDRDFPKLKDISGSVSKEIRNNSIMQLGDSFLYMAGNSEADATSTPVDMIINDELDLSNMEIIALFNSRYQHSDFKIKQVFSTPTYRGYGVSAEFDDSDQHEYFYQCPHCNYQQIPLYDLKSMYIPGLHKDISSPLDINMDLAIGLDLDNAYVRCVKCGKPLDLTDDSRREWVAKYPSRIHSRGYQVRPFSSPLLSIKYLVISMADYMKKNQLRRGVNTVLGEDFETSNSRMQESQIRKAFRSPVTPEISKDKPVMIGIDMGIICHLVLYVDGALIKFEQVHYKNLKDRIKVLMQKYRIIAGAIDRYPYTSLSEDIRDMTNGLIMPVVYGGMRDAEPKKDVDGRVIYYNINRTAALDRVKDGIDRESLQIYGYSNLDQKLIEHFRDMTREDEPGKPPTWVKLNGNDHFFHASAYSMVAEKIYYVEGLGQEKKEYSQDYLFVATPQIDTKEKNGIDKLNLVGYSSSETLSMFSGLSYRR